MAKTGDGLCAIEEFNSDDDDHRQDNVIKPSAMDVDEDLIQRYDRPIQQVLESCFKQIRIGVDAKFEALSAENQRLRQRLRRCEGEFRTTNNIDDGWPISNKISMERTQSTLADALSVFNLTGQSTKGDFMLQASVPVPPMMVANRQQPDLRVPADRKEMAATPPAHTDTKALKDVSFLRPLSSEVNAEDRKTSRKFLSLTSPPRTPDIAWKEVDSCSKGSNGSRLATPDFKGWQLQERGVSASVASHSRIGRGFTSVSRTRTTKTFNFVRETNDHGGSQGRKAFIDAEGMKANIRQNIDKSEYNVADYYKKGSIFALIASSSIFETFTLFVIGVNALYIGYNQEANEAKTMSDSDIGFKIADNAFCSYFFAEILIRYSAFESHYYLVRDFWFLFDAALSATMVLETWGMWLIEWILQSDSEDGQNNLGNASIIRLLRLLRLTRMARMVRLLRVMPELMILIKGMRVAMRSVFFTLCLLMLIVYIFGVAFLQLTEDTGVGKQYFDSMWDAMNTLLLNGTLLENCPEVAYALGDESPFLQLLFYLFVLMASLTVMNMLVGVLVEVVKVVSTVEKETLQVNFVKTRLASMLLDMDENHDGKISKAEFEILLRNADAARALHDVGVDVVGLVDYHDYLFANEQELTFAEFMEIVLSLRGSNGATVKDIVDLRKLVLFEMERLRDTMSAMTAQDSRLRSTAAYKESMRTSIRNTLRSKGGL